MNTYKTARVKQTPVSDPLEFNVEQRKQRLKKGAIEMKFIPSRPPRMARKTGCQSEA